MHFLLNQLVDLAIFFVMAASATVSWIMQEHCSSHAACSFSNVRKLRICDLGRFVIFFKAESLFLVFIKTR